MTRKPAQTMRKGYLKVPTRASQYKGGNARKAKIGGNKIFDSYFKPLKGVEK